LFDLPVVTGRFLRIFGRSASQISVEAGLSNRFAATVYSYPSILLPGQEISEFAGRGVQVSARRVEPGKIGTSDAFFFSVEGKVLVQPFVQVVVFFTTELNVRKVRVITVHVEAVQRLAMAEWIDAIVAHRLLNEGVERAREVLATFKRERPDEETRVVERLLSEKSITEKYRRALLVRNGGPAEEQTPDSPATL
jgi:hypothetical protein